MGERGAEHSHRNAQTVQQHKKWLETAKLLLRTQRQEILEHKATLSIKRIISSGTCHLKRKEKQGDF